MTATQASLSPRPTWLSVFLRQSHRQAATSSSFSTPMSLLTELPGEVVHIVCRFLSNADLLALSFACRYLHNVAYPVYLQRHGVGYHDGQLAVGDLRSKDAFQALHSALFTLRFHRLVIPFDLGQMPTDTTDNTVQGPRRQPMDSRSPNALRLDRVDHVQEAHIKFRHIRRGEWLDADRSLAGDVLLDLDTPEAAAVRCNWDTLTRDMLLRASCRTILVEADSQRCRVAPEKVEAAILGYYGLGTVYRLGFQIGNAFLAPFRWLGLPTPQFETFQVHTPILFHPSFCHWTLRTLNLPSLTAVSFDRLQDVASSTWGLILPCITLPKLRKLSINLCAMPTGDLYRFLDRHPTIEELSLGANLPRTDARTELPSLPKLRCLTAPAERLVSLLSSPDHPFPTLETVCVLYRTRRGSLFMSEGINNDLAPISLRLRSVKEVVLSVALESGAVDWLVSGRSEDGQPIGDLGYPEDLSSSSDSGVVGRSLRQRLPPPATVTFTGSCVTRLEVKVHQFVLTYSVVLVLPRWLKGFGRTQRLDLVTMSSVLGDGREGYTKLHDPFEMPNHRDFFLHSIANTCPWIQHVYVDGEEQELPPGRQPIVRLR